MIRKNNSLSRHYLDTAALYAALDQTRQARGLRWQTLARELGLPASTFTRLSYGGAPNAHALVTLLVWIGQPVTAFTVAREASPAVEKLTAMRAEDV